MEITAYEIRNKKVAQDVVDAILREDAPLEVARQVARLILRQVRVPLLAAVVGRQFLHGRLHLVKPVQSRLQILQDRCHGIE